MKVQIGILLSAVVSFWLIKTTIPWFTTDEDRQEKAIRIAARSLKVLALCFVGWALVIMFGLSKDMSRLELIILSMYGMLQIGFAVLLFSFPYILEKGTLAGIVEAFGDALNRN